MSDALLKCIHSAMQAETEKIVDEESRAAADRVAKRVRAMSGEIATQVASHVIFSQLRNEIVITVKIPEKE